MVKLAHGDFVFCFRTLWILLVVAVTIDPCFSFQSVLNVGRSWNFRTAGIGGGGGCILAESTEQRILWKRQGGRACHFLFTNHPNHRGVSYLKESGRSQEEKGLEEPLSPSDDDGSNTKQNAAEEFSSKSSRLGRKDGVYVRPSGAIERGSGFFVPGLEGSRVRVVVGTVLLIATLLNHQLSSSLSASNSVDEAISFSPLGGANQLLESISVGYSVLLLIQAFVEYRINSRRNSGLMSSSPTFAPSSPSSANSFQQQWFIKIPQQGDLNEEEWKDRVEWVAQTYVSLTPATHIALLGPGSIVYWLGETPVSQIASNDIAEGCQAALNTCFQSKTGRVSLPSSHPTVQSLQPALVCSDTEKEDDKPAQEQQKPRCFVLQKVDESNQLCLLMISNQLLESFTKRDLQWLGQFASYIQQAIPGN